MSDPFKQVPSLWSTTLSAQSILKKSNINVMILMALQVSGPRPNLLTFPPSGKGSGKKNKNKNKNPLERVVERKDIGSLASCSSFYRRHHMTMTIVLCWNLFLWALAESPILFGQCLLGIYHVPDFRHHAKHEGSSNKTYNRDLQTVE